LLGLKSQGRGFSRILVFASLGSANCDQSCNSLR
jgi:hypothetical protein